MELKFRINLLRGSYFFHFFIFAIIIFCNLTYKSNIIWITSLLNILFYISLLVLLFIAIASIVFLIIVFIKTTYKVFFILLKISSGLTIISLIIAICLIIIFIFNNKNYPTFYRNCPFNYNLLDIEKYFIDYKNRMNAFDKSNLFELKEICDDRRCLNININDEFDNKNDYSYICSYNSSIDFKDISENSVICEQINSKDLYNFQSIFTYINICNSINDFYLCKTSEIPQKYKIKPDYICPTKDKNSFSLEIFLSAINIIIPICVYIIQFIYYKNILKIIVSNSIQNNNNENGNGGTIDTSRKDEINKDINSFKKEPTELIIVDNGKNEDEIFNIYNKDKYKKRKQRNIANIKGELLMVDKTTGNPYINNPIIKNNNNNKEKNKISLENDIDEKNRSFFNSKSNYFNNDKNNLFDSKRIFTQINNEENIKSEIEAKIKKQSNEDSQVKCILIKNNK